jgi:hypothetical protein
MECATTLNAAYTQLLAAIWFVACSTATSTQLHKILAVGTGFVDGVLSLYDSCSTSAAAVSAQGAAMHQDGSSSAAASGAGQQGFASAAEEQEVEELLQKLDGSGVDRCRVRRFD